MARVRLRPFISFLCDERELPLFAVEGSIAPKNFCITLASATVALPILAAGQDERGSWVLVDETTLKLSLGVTLSLNADVSATWLRLVVEARTFLIAFDRNGTKRSHGDTRPVVVWIR